MLAAALKLLGPAGIAGLVCSIALAGLLVVKSLEVRHWKGESTKNEQLYNAEHAAFSTTVANYRAAAAKAKADDAANAIRAINQQTAISKESNDELQARLAAARDLANRLQQAASRPANSGGSRTTAVSAISGPASGFGQAAGQNGFSLTDRYLCTAQSIQLDELIKWVNKQSRVSLQGGDNDNTQPTHGATGAQ